MAEKKEGSGALPATPRTIEVLKALPPEQIKNVSEEELALLEAAENDPELKPEEKKEVVSLPEKKSKIEVAPTAKPKDKAEVVSIDELCKKKGWKREEYEQKSSEAYQNLEHFIEVKSKETTTTKEQMKALELELAKMKGMIEQAGKAPAAVKSGGNQEDQLALRERMEKLLTETPEMFAQAIIDETDKRVSKTVEERLKAIEERRINEQRSVEAAEKEFEEIIQLLPGVTQAEKEAEFEKIKPLLNEFTEKNPSYLTRENGLTDALYILIGKGQIKIIQDSAELTTEEDRIAQEKLDKQKKSIPGSPGQGGFYKAGITLDEFNNLSKTERDKVSQVDLDRLFLEENQKVS